MKPYHAVVTLTYVFRSHVEIEAESAEEARKLALEVAECEWSDSELIESEAQIIE